MKKVIKIGILTDGFHLWPGGMEFLKYVLLGIRDDEQLEYKLTLLIPASDSMYIRLKNTARFLFRRGKGKQLPVKSDAEVVKWLTNSLQVPDYFIYKNKYQLCRYANDQFDILLPSFYPITQGLKIPLIYYLYDFQHKYFEKNFSTAEIIARNKHFETLIKSSSALLVNARQVKSDILKFYGRTEKIFTIPFVPITSQPLDYSNAEYLDVQQTLGLKESSYFIICNQFWRHKDHISAFDAIKALNDTASTAVKLVCTGRFPDPLNAAYCQELTDYISRNKLESMILFTGFLSKEVQLILLERSVALIQPTQFEGGPGGFSVYEALGLNKRCIISDIPVNKEIENPLVSFFSVGNSSDLAHKLYEALHSAAESTAALTDSPLADKNSALKDFWRDTFKEILAEQTVYQQISTP